MHLDSFQEGFERFSRVDTPPLVCQGGYRPAKPGCNPMSIGTDRVASAFQYRAAQMTACTGISAFIARIEKEIVGGYG
jgi:hypothetical protein